MADALINSPIPSHQSFEMTGEEEFEIEKKPRRNLDSEFVQASACLQHVLQDTGGAPIFEAATATKTTNSSSAAMTFSHSLSKEQKSFSVHLRLRPSTTTTIELINGTTVRAHPPRQGATKDYTFTNILPATTSQFEVYQETAAPMVHGLFNSDASNSSCNKDHNLSQLGSSALLFCYGITNAGKTYTVTGDLNHESKWGVLPRALQDAFHRSQAAKLTLQIAYMEIYNEQVYDLLQPPDKYTRACPQVKIRENHYGMAVCKGLVQMTVESVQHGLALVHSAKSKRQTSSNNLNSGSSRSHCICQLTVMDNESQQQVNMWIVDLAGSERSKRTDAGQARMKEASQINKSLMTLMRCLMALREDSSGNSNKPKERPPYRDSKITHLLMNHLTGPSAGRTTMIVNVHPAECDFEETQHVLQYAAQAKHVVVNANHQHGGDSKKAAVQYGENGRKIVPHGKGTMAKLISKLSPLLSPAARARKRKGDQNGKDAHGKKLKPAAGPTASSATTMAAAAVGKPKNAEPSKEVRRLKMQLSVLQVENQNLKRNNERLSVENESLKDQLEAMEENVRAEVVDEMEAKQIETNEKYESIINELKHNLREHVVSASTTKSTRKMQKDRADEQINDLLDSLAESKEENQRQRIEHDTVIQTLKVNHEQQIEKLQSQIKTLMDAKAKYQLRKNGNIADGDGEPKDADSLSMELRAAQSQIAKLQEENANYKKYMGDGDEDDGDDEEEDDMDDVDGDDDDKEGDDEQASDPECADDDNDQEEEHEAEASFKPDLFSEASFSVNVETEIDLAHENATDFALNAHDASDAADVEVCKPVNEPNETLGVTDDVNEDAATINSPLEPKSSSAHKGRLPLGDVAQNFREAEDSDDEFGPNQWLFPKKGPKKDEQGSFLRPKGRKPKNAEDWDSRRGAWRLSMA
ncbi:hypothetical protein MPSEU_000411100 [Mayamaea pseudoterrestris]|nr:hypothetical protein MPSEU_000411100 [Mayamaea pseudoterrestris]